MIYIEKLYCSTRHRDSFTNMDMYSLLQNLYTVWINYHFILLLLLIIPPPLIFIQKRGILGTKKLPPGPIRLPVIGNLHQLNGLPHHSIPRLSSKYGPLMFLQLGSIPTLVVSSADIAREIFTRHDIVFSGRPVLYATKKLGYNSSDLVFAPYGEYWRQIRKIAVLELLSTKKVQSFRNVREEEVATMIASIASSRGPIDLSEMLLLLSNDLICRVAFGRKYDKGDNNRKSEFHALLQKTQNLLGGFMVADFFPWLGWIHKLDGQEADLENIFRQWDEFYDIIIDDHLNPKRPKPELEDLVDVLLQVQGDPSRCISLSRDQIKAILTDMFIAGTDTSAATIVWAMTELIKNPTLMKKAQEEVRQVVGNMETVKESDLPQLKYLRLVVKEALRLHNPNPLLVPRETTENCTILGYDLPAKTRMVSNKVQSPPLPWPA
ncbi:Cytochrome p450 [Thalictrum thalictroides]|uniref:Cytochrome p450 n=1 Tax=Thalictrum thalictroides TaxID=46969 RepID=A0A7J6WT49_THATH|nr:Cytochrome p450 [Thalictrum thalictroides]